MNESTSGRKHVAVLYISVLWFLCFGCGSASNYTVCHEESSEGGRQPCMFTFFFFVKRVEVLTSEFLMKINACACYS